VAKNDLVEGRKEEGEYGEIPEVWERGEFFVGKKSFIGHPRSLENGSMS